MRNIKTVLLLFAVACAPSSPAPPVRGPKLSPPSEWNREHTLTAFRGQVLEDIRARNTERLFGYIDPDVRASFARRAGIEAFKSAWYVRPHWRELEQIFYAGGGRFLDSDHFTAPAIDANWPQQLDPHSFVVVMSPNAELRDSRSTRSRPIATLRFDVVQLLGEPGHVKTADGRTGWVDPTVLFSPVRPRVTLVRSRGTWKIEEFTAGE